MRTEVFALFAAFALTGLGTPFPLLFQMRKKSGHSLAVLRGNLKAREANFTSSLQPTTKAEK
jgi:hypothetical protein